MSTISAGTTSGTALVSSGDTTGNLVFQTNGTTPSVTLAANGAIGVGSTPGYGTSGQVLTSAGAAAAPTWAPPNTGNFGVDVAFTDYTLTTSSALTSGPTEGVQMQSVSLDGVSQLMVFGGNSSAHAIVWNGSTNTFGTPVLVRAADNFSSVQTIGLVAISATSVLVCSLPEGATSLQTVVLTISGSTVTVGTAVATTLSAASSLVVANTRLVTVGSSYVLTYGNNSGQAPKFRAITVSGATPTVGSELAYAGGNSLSYMHSYAHSSSVLMSFSANATTFFAYPISVSGATLTGGTAATATTNSNIFCTGLLSTGRYAALFLNTTARGAVVTVTGTTASISTAATTTATGGWNPVMQVFSNQAIFVTGQASGDGVNVITDTSGTATVGTRLSTPFGGAITGFLSGNKILFSSITPGNTAYLQYGISSGSPVLEKTFENITSTSTITTYAFESGTYRPPLSGPPQSGSAMPTILRTTAGKIAPALSGQRPFSITIDGTSHAKLQQYYFPFNTSAYNDAISTAVCWGLPTSTGANTTLQVRRMILS